jgi:hypothetical protein
MAAVSSVDSTSPASPHAGVVAEGAQVGAGQLGERGGGSARRVGRGRVGLTERLTLVRREGQRVDATSEGRGGVHPEHDHDAEQDRHRQGARAADHERRRVVGEGAATALHAHDLASSRSFCPRQVASTG